MFELVSLGRDLALGRFAGGVDREPFAERHRKGTGQESGETGDEDRMRCQVGSGDSHDEAHIRDEPVIGAEDRSAQRVAAHPAVPALQSGVESRRSARLARLPRGPR